MPHRNSKHFENYAKKNANSEEAYTWTIMPSFTKA